MLVGFSFCLVPSGGAFCWPSLKQHTCSSGFNQQAKMGMDANEIQCGKETAGQRSPCRGTEGHLLVFFRIKVGNVTRSHREKQGPIAF